MELKFLTAASISVYGIILWIKQKMIKKVLKLSNIFPGIHVIVVAVKRESWQGKSKARLFRSKHALLKFK